MRRKEDENVFGSVIFVEKIIDVIILHFNHYCFYILAIGWLLLFSSFFFVTHAHIIF